MQTIKEFIEHSTHPAPDGVVTLRQLFESYYATISRDKRKEWNRTRLVVEMTKAGYEILIDNQFRAVIIGRRLPSKKLVVENGMVRSKPLEGRSHSSKKAQAAKATEHRKSLIGR